MTQQSEDIASIPQNDGTTLVIRRARQSDAEYIVTLVNWAFRGKPGTKPWTTEIKYFNGPRTTLDDVKKAIENSTDKPNDYVTFVSVRVYDKPVSQNELSDSRKLWLSPTEQLMGTSTQQRQHDHQCPQCAKEHITNCNHTVYASMGCIDPDYASSGMSKQVIQVIDQFLMNQWHCNTRYSHIIAERTEWMKSLIERQNWTDTGIRYKFDLPQHNQYVRPEWKDKLTFAILTRPIKLSSKL